MMAADELLYKTKPIERVLNPRWNRYRLESLNVWSRFAADARVASPRHYTFAKRISHTADSQDQRHRMVPASRPLLTLADAVSPDYVMPRLISANPAARVEFEGAMLRAWVAKERLRALGVPLEFAIYLLPNAKAVRLIESGPLIALCTSGRCGPASTHRRRSFARLDRQ